MLAARKLGLEGLGAESVSSTVTFAGQPLPCCADALAAIAGGCDDSCVATNPQNAVNSPGTFFDWANNPKPADFSGFLSKYGMWIGIAFGALVVLPHFGGRR